MKPQNLRNLLVTVFLGMLLNAMPIAAADLAQAKSAGLLGEQMNGLLGLVDPGAPADVKTLMASINAQRQAEYQRIAAKNGVPASEVAKLAAQKVFEQTPSGQYIETPSGWQKR